MICYVLMRMKSTQAITAAVILSLVLCCLSIAVYHWQDEIFRPIKGLPVYDVMHPHTGQSQHKKELNTLV